MLPTRQDHHRLARYRGSDNLSRVASLSEPRRQLAAVGRAPGVSVVVLNLDRPDLIVPLIDQLLAAADVFRGEALGLQVIVGDTGSTDAVVLDRYDKLDVLPDDRATVVRDDSYHFSRSNNDAANGRVVHDHILFLNNDVAFSTPEQVLQLYRCAQEHHSGIVGLALDFPDGAVQHRGIDVVRRGDSRGQPFHPRAHQPATHDPGRSWATLAVTGACLLVRTTLWTALGGLSEDYQKEGQDVDLCFSAARLGHEVRMLDAGPVIHIENATRVNGEECWSDRRLLARRWESYIEAGAL